MNVLGMIKNENLVALKKWQYTENDWKHPQAHSVHIAGRRLSYGSSDVRSQNSGNQRAHSLRHVHGCFYSKCGAARVYKAGDDRRLSSSR